MAFDPVIAHGLLTLLTQVSADVLAWVPMDQAPLDPVPEDREVKAGWTALLLWIGMAVAVAVLAFSLVRRLRKARDHYGDVDADKVAEEPDPRFKDESGS
jgi:TRAP-type C4-dicarboxylate transport system permease small subunit